MHNKIAKIQSTFLGREDHGIMTATLEVDYGGSGQCIGGYVLDDPLSDEDGKFIGRRGREFGMEWIIRCMDACGVDQWEKIPGRTVFVYFDSDDWNAKPLGVGPLPTERGKKFMFDELTPESRMEWTNHDA